MKKVTKSEAQTIKLGEQTGKKLEGGEVFLLVGDLGAGKTTFIKGVAKGLGIKRHITSPTFVLMKVYNVTKHKVIKTFVHIDTYRGLSIDDLDNIGAMEYFMDEKAVSFVEWGVSLEKHLIKYKIKFTKVLIRNIDQQVREINIK
jgi:tRNA threonylcarbamoyladenosine biosynthesis protein TsaE